MKRKKSEKPEHRVSAKIRYGLEPVQEAFLQLDESAAYFLKGLKQDYPRNCGMIGNWFFEVKS